MSEIPSLSRSGQAESEKLEQYRAIHGMAVVGFIIGIFSFISYFGIVLWAIPVLGIIVGLRAWYRISHEEGLMGKKFAIIGVAFSLFFLGLTVTNTIAYSWALQNQASQVADQWFEFLLDGQICRAYQLTLTPGNRVSPEKDPTTPYRNNSEKRQQLEQWLKHPAIQVLRKWGNEAKVGLMSRDGCSTVKGQDICFLSYKIFHDGKDYYMQVLLKRQQARRKNQLDWIVGKIQADNLPKSRNAAPEKVDFKFKNR
jgi:hypothetical protein